MPRPTPPTFAAVELFFKSQSPEAAAVYADILVNRTLPELGIKVKGKGKPGPAAGATSKVKGKKNKGGRPKGSKNKKGNAAEGAAAATDAAAPVDPASVDPVKQDEALDKKFPRTAKGKKKEEKAKAENAATAATAAVPTNGEGGLAQTTVPAPVPAPPVDDTVSSSATPAK